MSTMMICLFLRLSTIKILPRAANHVKNAALEGARVRHTLFQGNLLLSEQAKGAEEGLDLEQSFLERDPSEPICMISTTMTKCSTWKKEAKTTTSQLCASLTKLTFH
jgi:hypothetical protein